MEEGISANDIKIEFDNGLLYCEQCEAYYEDYCIECGMLVQILNRNAPNNSDNRTRQELPNDILEIQDLSGHNGIFSLRVIPKGVKFGPFTGLHRMQCPWKINGRKFVVDKDRLRYLNWMQYINTAENTSERNLIFFQCKDYLYCQSTCQIQPGEQLLVYYGEEFEDSLNENDEVSFNPTTEHIKDVFCCTFCCLGFSSKMYLAKHKTLCPAESSSTSFVELAQCPFCKIHLCQKEYLTHHLPCCCERDVRKYCPPAPSDQIPAVSRPKTHCRRQLYKCEQCKYMTKYKAKLKDHTINQHFHVKKFKCEICYRRFKTKKDLRLHVENTHIYGGAKEDPSHYMNTNIKEEQSNSEGETRTFKCHLCDFRTKYKVSLTKHIKTKHLEKYDYKCDSCEYQTVDSYQLKIHISTSS